MALSAFRATFLMNGAAEWAGEFRTGRNPLRRTASARRRPVASARRRGAALASLTPLPLSASMRCLLRAPLTPRVRVVRRWPRVWPWPSHAPRSRHGLGTGATMWASPRRQRRAQRRAPRRGPELTHAPVGLAGLDELGVGCRGVVVSILLAGDLVAGEEEASCTHALPPGALRLGRHCSG